MKIDKKVGEAQRCANAKQRRTEAWPSVTQPLGESKSLAYPTTARCSGRKPYQDILSWFKTWGW